MKVLIATEGQGEYSAFKLLFSGLPVVGGSLSSIVLRVTCQPDGPMKGIAKACAPVLRQAQARRVDLFVLVIDREQQREAAGELAKRLQAELEKVGSWDFKIRVVYKDRAFENWLVADIKAIRAQPARFDLTEAARKSIEPDKADRVNALAILDKAANGRRYEKIEDGKKIVAKFDVIRAAKNSRSLRHMLHVLGAELYSTQCRQAV